MKYSIKILLILVISVILIANLAGCRNEPTSTTSTSLSIATSTSETSTTSPAPTSNLAAISTPVPSSTTTETSTSASPPALETASTTISTSTTSSGGGGTGNGGGTSYSIKADILGTSYKIKTDSKGRVLSAFSAVSTDGELTLEIQAGTTALDQEGGRLTHLTVEANSNLSVPPEGTEFVTPVYSFGSEGATFDPPLKLALSYNLESFPKVAEDLLYFASYDAEQTSWDELTGITPNTTQHTITASISHFSDYAVIGHTTRTIKDMYGTELTIPAVINRVLSGGPVETQLIYMLAPDKLCAVNGTDPNSFWNSSWDGSSPYVQDKYKNLPNIGSWSSSQQNYEAAIATNPDMVLEGKTKNLSTYREHFGDIPIIGVNAGDSLLWDYVDEIRFVGQLLDASDKAEELIAYYTEAMDYVNNVVEGIRPPTINDNDTQQQIRVYYAEGTDGLSTDAKGSWHTNLLWFCGGANVANVEVSNTSAMINVDMEQIFEWDDEIPIDMIIIGRSSQQSTYDYIMNDSLWNQLDCVKRGALYIRPDNPTSWFDGPPGYGQIVGMYWMVHQLYPNLTPDLNLNEKIKEYYSKFMHYELTDSELRKLLSQPPSP